MRWRAWGKSWLITLPGIILTLAGLWAALDLAGISAETDGQYLAVTALGGVVTLPWLIAQAFLWDRFDRRSL